MTKLRQFVVCHIHAVIWAFTHIALTTVIAFIWYRRWDLLVVYGTSLVLVTHIRFRKSQRVIDFFIPALEELCGGVRIVREHISESTRPRMYAVHPHGIIANGFGFAMQDCVSRGERVSVAVTRWICLLNPLFRWFVNSMGCELISVSKSDLHRSMRRGDNIAILPGGFEEVLMMEDRRDVVFLRKRSGFLHMASKYGYEVVPVFLFGESQLYKNYIMLPSFVKRWSSRLRMPLVIPRGRTFWNFLPSSPRRGMVIVFGDPVVNNREGDLQSMHRDYLDIITAIYSKYNPYPEYELTIL